MRKYLKVTSICLLMIFSFYYTEKIALYVQNNTPLKKEIIAFKEKNKVDYINAKVEGEYITPGVNGLEINVDKSYENMKLSNEFNKSQLVYNEVTPSISINDYPEKIIKSGNPSKNAVSIIVNNNDSKYFFESNNIKYSYISNEKYCVVGEKCDSFKKKIKPSIILNNTNFLRNVSNIKNGDIIYIDGELQTKYLNVLIKQIEYSNLSILSIDNHLSENNNM